MKIDPQYKGLIRSDATALLRPKTGLKDMFIELNPGSTGRVLKENETLPISATAPDVNPDEIFSALDADTRDYLKLLIGGAGKGLAGRGTDLRDLFRRFEPTHRDLARVTSAVAVRRENLRRLVHNLNLLNHELADHGDQLATLISSSATVLHSFASEEQQISGAVKELPSTLQTTTAALDKVDAFAKVLKPAAHDLRPAARSLDAANKAIIPLAKSATPLLAKDIRPFVRNARPLVRDLKPAASNLNKATPNLTGIFQTFNHFLDMLAYNPGGAESPSNAARQEGYLFWLAWASHDALNLFATADANGVLRPVTLGAPCNTFKSITAEQPELEFLQGLTPILQSTAACGK
jgi:phospholipid/cholesterol/gamma-HCH transport system substrate-binding protein